MPTNLFLPELVANNFNVINDEQAMFPVTRAEVYWCLFDKGSCTAQDIAVGTGMSKITAYGHLAALEKAGALRGEGSPKLYRITENPPLEYIVKLQELESLARSAWRLRGFEPL